MGGRQHQFCAARGGREHQFCAARRGVDRLHLGQDTGTTRKARARPSTDPALEPKRNEKPGNPTIHCVC